MPKCNKCGKTQSQLNKGALCKTCFNDKINKPIPTCTDGISNTNNEENNDDGPIIEDRNVIDFIKQHMIREQQWHEETLKHLREEVIYLKQEIVHKNKFVEALMTELSKSNGRSNQDIIYNDNKNNSFRHDSADNCASSNNSCIPSNNISLTRESDLMHEDNRPITNNFMDWQPVEIGNNNIVNSKNSDIINVTTKNRYNPLLIDDDLESDNELQFNSITTHQKPYVKYNDVRQSTNRRPSNVINKNPQHDTFVFHQAPKHIPGNSSYASIADKGKKIAIITDSLCSRIKMKSFNQYIVNGHAYRKAFPGGTSEQIAHYCTHTLSTDNPDTVIINAGSNDIQNLECDVIAKNILRIVDICRDNGVNKVFVSSIIYRRGLNHKVSELNNLLKSRQLIHDYILIDNSNVTSCHIWVDNIHPNNQGVENIANNFINAINRYNTS